MSKAVRSALMSLSLFLFLGWLYGCDDAGLHDTDTPQTDASIDVPAADVMAPTVAIIFPGYAALLTEGRITVRGIAQDQSTITRVTVQDSAAHSMDGFATWEASVALPPGTTRLVVSAEDAFGNANAMAATVTVSVVEPLWRSPTGLAVEATGQLVVTDSDLQAIVRLESQSGLRTIVSNAAVGSGPSLRFPQSIVVEATGQLLVLDQFPTALVRIDPQSGARQVVVDETTSSEPALQEPRSIALTATGHVVVLDVFPTEGPAEGFPPLTQGRVLQLDLSSGIRAIISDTLIGRGPLLEFPQDIAVEAQGTFVVLGAVAGGMAGHQVIGWRVIRVNPADGARTLLTEEVVTSDLSSLAPQGIAVEDDGNLVVVDHVTREGNLRGWRIVRIHSESGMRTVLADTTLGDRFPAVFPSDIAVEPNGQLVVADRIVGNFGARGGHVVRVAPDSGARTIVSSEGIGNGPLLRFPGHIAIEPDGHLIVAEESSPAVIRVDAATGERTMVSDDMTGGGAALRDMLQGIAVEPSGQLVVVDEFFPAIVRVTPDTGIRTIISDEHTGSGPAFLSLLDIAVEATGHLVVIDEFLKAVLQVDPFTGARSIVSDEQRGSGPLFGPFLRSVVVEASGHLVVVDGTVANGRPIIRIHPLTGGRTIVSDASVGSGPSLVVPRGIAVETSGALLVVDRALRAVVRIDPVSGDRRVLSDDMIGVGPVFSDPVDITVENTDQIIVLDMGLRAIVRVEAQHGDRAIISR